MAYMLSLWLKMTKAATIAHDKSHNYCPRRLPGVCHGDDFGLVEKWK